LSARGRHPGTCGRSKRRRSGSGLVGVRSLGDGRSLMGGLAIVVLVTVGSRSSCMVGGRQLHWSTVSILCRRS